jgi:hypothetical protein
MEEALFLIMGERGAPSHLRKNKCGTYTYTLTVDIEKKEIAIK